MRVQFNTVTYEMSHGRKPRGPGYWGFFFGFSTQEADQAWFVQAGSFADAKKKAKVEAERRGLWYVRVAP